MRPSFVQKAAVLSIHPKFADAILRGTKRVELRKPPFPKDISSVVIYATSPIRYLVGRFEVEGIMVDRPGVIYLRTEGLAGVGIDDYEAYYKGKKWAVAIFIRNACEFKTLIDPEKYIRNWTPPQSFRYITLNEYDRIVAAGSKLAGGPMPPKGRKETGQKGAGPKRGLDSPPSPPGSLSRGGML
jgi:predicted transcriptional regulator